MSGPVPAEALTRVQRRLARFAATYPGLRLYRRVCEGAAGDEEVARLLTAAAPGQDRPVLLLAALHELVLRRPEVPAARWYPSVTGAPVPDGDPWPDVRAAALAHSDELRAVIATRSTQTNEVNRAVYLAPMVARAGADGPDAPVALVEVGCSAGLLLGLDRYRVELRTSSDPANRVRESRLESDSRTRDADASGGIVLGDPSSVVVCGGEARGDVASLRGLRLPVVAERVGLDRTPVALGDAADVRWLEACLWPEVPGRLERFRAAVAVLASDPPDVVAGDMVDDLAAVGHAARAVAAAASGAPEAVHLVVTSSWSITYVERERRSLMADALAELAGDGRPVSWLTAEPPGCIPGLPPVAATEADPPGGVTVLGARRWRHGQEVPPAVWGTAHPHGEWIRWGPPA